MQHIGSLLEKLQTFVSRDAVIKSRLIDICQSFLNIKIDEKKIQVSERIIVVSSIPYVEKLLIQREKQTLLAYIHANPYEFKVEDLIVR